MRVLPFATRLFLGTIAVAVCSPSWPALGQAPDAARSADANADVLLQGPVHEAFAQPYTADPKEGVVVKKKPPAAIEEIPPSVRPEGDVVWIPGYWGFDVEGQDFIWISGLWREPPPGQRWVPGYWQPLDGGYQWVSGFWTAADRERLEYLPVPPESQEAGPSSPAPSEEHFWVPGCWMYVDGRYQWRPGYWMDYYDNWTWVPCHYVWTPRGCIYVDGYWDYTHQHRGVLFAPLRFHAGVDYTRYRYSPHHVLNLGSLLHFFVHPGYHHYYFGDYYDDRYARSGLRPWHRFASGRGHYDPLYLYYRHRSRKDDVDYGQRFAYWHQYFQRDKERRPVRTLDAFDKLRRQKRDDDRVRLGVAARALEELRDSREHRFRQLDPRLRQRIVSERKQLSEIARQRHELERRGTDAKSPRGEKSPRRELQLPRTRQPVVPRGGETRERPGADRPSKGKRPEARPRRPQPEARKGRPDPRARHPRPPQRRGRVRDPRGDTPRPQPPPAAQRRPRGESPSGRARPGGTPRPKGNRGASPQSKGKGKGPGGKN